MRVADEKPHAAPAVSDVAGTSSTATKDAEEKRQKTPREIPFPADCGACKGAMQMIDAFSRFSKTGSDQQQRASGTVAAFSTGVTSTPDNNSRQKDLAPAAEGAAASGAAHSATAVPSQASECPVNSAQLGRATWTFLHTMAAYYPADPAPEQQSRMQSFIAGLAEFYPCHYCAAHLREQVAATPPEVSSNTTLSNWFCRIHNEVNEMLGKPLFDCSRVMERWRTGPADGSCDDQE